MATAAQRPKLLVIVGETASGKSALALKVAKEFDGEIIAADSRTIYKTLDIGTAKPTAKERKAVPHWGLDLVDPSQKSNVAQFKNYAGKKIKEAQNRGKLPILVGGSGLYVDSILFDYQFSLSEVERDPQNPRHLKKTAKTGLDTKLWPDALIIGLRISREELKLRVAQRVEKMVQEGLTEEIKAAADRYGWDANALQAPGYKAFKEYIAGEIDLETAKKQFIKNDLDLAKRQRTWFKRNRHINWFNSPEAAYQAVKKQLLNN
ncbi:MAG TPA: tRNA (adenosine(37)-N6)-dimethylallyltransferase MiaA [Candidatus Saccharimonadales bacterium]|nr:tRNA (adenosine(37)-N6)-dimethylallyltransferase MiaA [Candidatus Saccharimonadales bacterium]